MRLFAFIFVFAVFVFAFVFGKSIFLLIRCIPITEFHGIITFLHLNCELFLSCTSSSQNFGNFKLIGDPKCLKLFPSFSPPEKCVLIGVCKSSIAFDSLFFVFGSTM